MSGVMNGARPSKAMDANAVLRVAPAWEPLPQSAAAEISFRAACARNPLISPVSRKFFAIFCNKWKLFGSPSGKKLKPLEGK